MIDVFTPKRISPDCSFKSNRRQVKIFFFSPRFAVCLCGVHPNAEQRALNLRKKIENKKRFKVLNAENFEKSP